MKKLMLNGLIFGLLTTFANGQMKHMNHEPGAMEFGISGDLNIASNNCVLESNSAGSAYFAYVFVGNIFVNHRIMPDFKIRFGVGVVNGGSDIEYPIHGVLTSFKTRSVYLDFPLLAKYGIATFDHHLLYAIGEANSDT